MEATRTLVKSPPELWAEVSDVAALTRHLGEFGEIRITRTEPESVVEWEGDRTSGTVRLEPAGWGTRVTLTVEPLAGDTAVGDASADAPLDASSPDATADPPSPEATADPSSDATADPSPPGPTTADPSSPDETADPSSPDATTDADSEPLRESRRGFFARLFGRLRRRRPPDEAPAVGPADTVDSAEAADPPQAPVALTPEPTPPLEPPQAPPVDPPQAPPVDPPEAPPVDPPDAPPVDPPEAPPVDPPEAPPADPAMAAVDGAAVLAQALDALGKAHHRPYSR